MRSIDIETLYQKIDGHIILTGIISENKYLPQIIKMCRMKPYSVFKPGFKTKTKLEKHWVDEFGNSIKIDNKNINIIYNDKSLIPAAKISTDLFYGNNILNIKNNSKDILYIEKDAILVFYGIDEYLRAFKFDNEWVRIAPISIGIENITNMINNFGGGRIKEINNGNYIIPLSCKKYVCDSINNKLVKEIFDGS